METAGPSFLCSNEPVAVLRNSELQEKSRNVYVFGLTSFMNDTASEMAYWILPAFLVSIGAGAIAGPLAAWLLVSHVGLRGVFWAAAVPGLLSILAVTLWAKETGAGRTKEVPAEQGVSLRPRLSGNFYYLLAAAGIFSLGNS